MNEATEKEIKDFYEDCYDWDQVKALLQENNLSEEKFNKWMYGQTGLVIQKDGKQIFGYFKWDVKRFVEYGKRNQTAPIFD